MFCFRVLNRERETTLSYREFPNSCLQNSTELNFVMASFVEKYLTRVLFLLSPVLSDKSSNNYFTPFIEALFALQSLKCHKKRVNGKFASWASFEILYTASFNN